MTAGNTNPGNPGGFAGLLMKIPGFKGYLEREYRREEDHRLRQHLVGTVVQARNALQEGLRSLSGSLNLVGMLQSPLNQLQQLESAIQFAPHGYSAFFDAEKIDGARLERAYQHDITMVETTVQIRDICCAVRDGLLQRLDTGAALSQLRTLMDTLQQQLAQRHEILKGF